MFKFMGLDTHYLKPSGSNREVDNLMELHNSWVLKLGDKDYYFKYDVFLKLVQLSKFKKLLFIFNNPISIKVGDYVYKRVSSSRSCK